jgi:hypothetical protein
MARRYIDFISAYCDSWCERCAFTDRCSSFAVKSALGMCDGDHDAAMELALGPPRVPGGGPHKNLRERMADALGDFEPSQKELDAIGRELDERRQRIARHAVAESSLDYAVAATRWRTEHGHGEGDGDAAVREAIETIGWDSYLIHVKIMRALDGRDEHPDGAPFEKNAVQSDWNGSAKVALLSIERSERAWRTVAAATANEAAAVLAGVLEGLRLDMTREFPKAMAFKRPGFDEVGRSKR